jgi:hypothetical protein
MDILTNNAFGLFVMIVAPGFISVKIWGLLHPIGHISFADSLYEAVFYGVLNYFAFVQWLPPLMMQINSTLQVIAYIASLVITPILLPVLWKYILSLVVTNKNVINPIPKAWDVFFGKRQPCFMRIHLKNGETVGGLYAHKSAVSSYPAPEDLYLEELWGIDDEGLFTQPLDLTMGLLVSYDSIDYIELFHYVEKGELSWQTKKTPR